MAPGIYSFYDHMERGTVGSNPSSFSPPLKSSITSPSLSPFSLKIDNSSISTDHDYVLKPIDELKQPALTLGDKLEVELIDMEESDSPHSDAMLTSCAVDMEHTADQSDDTSFLQELDDLSFNIEDLNPCSGVTIEDSFQDFIDSALEKSFNRTDFQDLQKSQSQDAVILHKEDFMGILGLRPAQNNLTPSTSQTTEPDDTKFIFGSPFTSTSDNICSTSPPLTPTNNTFDLIPTKKCSCSMPNSLTTSLYSTAHSHQQDSVRTSTSISASANGVFRSSSCMNCTLSRLSSQDFSTPLTIDTSYGSPEYFEPLSKECLDILNDNDEDMGSSGDEILKWLHENQQQQHDSNNNIVDFNNSSNGAAVANFAETPKQGSDIDMSMDFESFVDLEDLITTTTTTAEPTQRFSASEHKENCDQQERSSHDHTYQKHVGEDSADRRDTFGAQLRLSFLDEFSHYISDTTKHEPDFFMTDQSPRSIDSPSHFAKQWDDHTDTNSDFSSPFPSPSSQTNPNSPYMKCPKDVLKDKSHLALLDLFSDENATSLLHSDSAVPNFRFM